MKNNELEQRRPGPVDRRSVRSSMFEEMKKKIRDREELLPIFRCIYLSVIVAIILSVAIYQGFLTRAGEDDLINKSIDFSCRSAFDLVNDVWDQSALLAQTVSASFIANNLTISQAIFKRLGETKTIKNLNAMTSLQFVKHLKDDAARLAYEIQMQNEFPWLPAIQNRTNYTLHGFGFDLPIPWNEPPYDPIIYTIDYNDIFIFGFLPRPEPRMKKHYLFFFFF